MTKLAQTERASPRQPVLLDARCRKTSWVVNQVELVNISPGGCCILGRIDGIGVDDEVTLRIADFAAIQGRVRWIRKREAGLAFNDALDARTVDALAATYTPGEARQAGYRGSPKAA